MCPSRQKDRPPDSSWKVLDVLRWTSERFTAEGVASPRLEAEVLLAHCLGVERVRLYMDFDKPLQRAELAAYREVIKRRLANEPVAYITGYKEFWSLPIAVSPAVMIPRPESELLVEVALTRARGRAPFTIVDVCTGSGAIAVAIAKELPKARVLATEIDADAVEVARANVSRLGVKVELFEGDLLDALPEDQTADLVVANPPYIARDAMERLDPVVAREPAAALDGGEDGLELIRRLIPQAAERLHPGGALVLEIGCDQGERVVEQACDQGFFEVEVLQDLAGLDRVVCAEMPLDAA